MSIRRLLVGLALLPIALLVLAIGAWYWLLYSESGARWAWGQAEAATDGALTAVSVSGALTPGLRIDALTFASDSILVEVETLDLRVNVDVFPLAVEIGPALATSARIEIIANDSVEPNARETEFEMPIPVSVSNLEVRHLAIEGVTDDGDLHISSAMLSGTLDSYLLNAAAQLNLPQTGPLDISVDGSGDLGSFTATHLTIGSDAGTIDGSARASWRDEILVDADLGWTSLAWPSLEEPQLLSGGGDVTVDWSAEGWSIRGDIDAGTPRIPSGTLAFDALGDADQVSVEIREGRVLGGTITGSAGFSWQGEQPVSLVLQVDDIDVAAIEDRVPATISGAVSVSGQLQPRVLTASLNNVNGEFDGATLLANGTVNITDSDIAVDDLRIEHGDSYARFNGWTSDPEGLRFDIALADLAPYIDEASGRVQAAGALSLNESRPFVRFDASSESLSYTGTRLDDIRIEARLFEQAQTLAFQARRDGIGIDLLASGLFDNWREPTQWSGQLQRVDVETGEIDLSVSAPASLEVAADRVSIAGLCLTDNDLVHACSNASWSKDEGADVEASLTDTPVSLVNRFFDTQLDFDQLITGRLDWQMVDGTSSGDVAVSVSAGTIVNADRPEIRIVTEPGELGFRIVEDDIRAGALNLPMTDFGEIVGQFAIEDIADGEFSEVEGTLRARVIDIGLLAALLPAIDSASGALYADISLSGSVVDPIYSGEVKLDDGSLSYRPIGLRLDEINISSQLSEKGELELTGQMRMGEGTAYIKTRSDLRQVVSGGMEVQLNGENLTVVDVPDLKAIATTDLDLGFDGKTLSINGVLDFPSALVKPTSLGTSKVSESEDVIIVAGELPHEEASEAPAIDLRIEGELTVSVGNDVTVDVGLAQADVTGSAVMTWTGDVIPVANGRYSLSGDILAFGQKLEIVEGGVRFPNVPADEPLVRLMAMRQIFGNSEVREAGVLIDGRLANPTIEAFTRPLTTEERALTLLVTGSDFNYEQGIGAVDFGTYIAPRVYASYGIGLFDQENVVRVRYDLTRGFGITATSGQKENGLDLSYRFDN